MTGLIRRFLYIAAILAAASAIPAGVLTAGEFRADLVKFRDGKTIESRVAVKGTLEREEIPVGEGSSALLIHRPDKGVVWNVIMDQRMYIAMPYSDNTRQTAFDLENLDGPGRLEPLGEEEMNGYRCDKYRIVYQEEPLGTMIQWHSKKLDFPVRTEFRDPAGNLTSSMDYRNIEETAVADSEFLPPPGFREMLIPGRDGRPMMPGLREIPGMIR